jgi:predicted nucleotidyltransferase
MLKHSIRYPQKLSIIEAISSYLIGQREGISIAYLFGSFITGESFLDIDLGVLTERELERPRRYLAEVVNAPV